MALRVLRSRLLRWSILMIVVLWAWTLSYARADLIAFYTPAGNLQVLGSHRGVITLFFSNICLGSRERGLTFDHEACLQHDYEELQTLLASNGPAPAAFQNFSIGHSAWDVFGFHGGWFRYVTVPYIVLPPIILAQWAIPALRRTLKSRTRQRRLRLGHCPVCGYDTRFATGRCSECGSELPYTAAHAALAISAAGSA